MKKEKESQMKKREWRDDDMTLKNYRIQEYKRRRKKEKMNIR